MMIVASHDYITMTDLELATYERALEPKKLVMSKGGHFDPHLSKFEKARGAAAEWFARHLAR